MGMDESIFEKSSNGKKVKCKICECLLPSISPSSLESHVNGGKHKLNEQNKQHKQEVFSRSVYVRGFSPTIENLEHRLSQHFNDIGCCVKDVYVDKNSSSYAIIEFTCREMVDLAVDKNHTFDGEKLYVKKRQQKEKKTKEKQIGKKYSLVQEVLRDMKQANLTDLSAQMEFIEKRAELSAEELSLRQLVCELLQNVLEELHPRCQVVTFGSSINQLAVKGCDLDLTLLLNKTTRENLGDCQEGNGTPEEKCANSKEDEREEQRKTFNENEENGNKNDDTLQDIREVIERFAPGCKNVMLVRSLTSVVKFLHAETNIKVDLSLNNRLGIANSELIATYVEMSSAARRLLFAVRLWNNTAGVSNYILALVTIHFLQRTNVLPCLQQCEHEITPRFVQGWDCAYCQLCNVLNTQINAGDLLLGFFQYYSKFDFSRHAIAIHTLQTQEKASMQTIFEVSNQLLNNTTPIVVQDPFKRSHNVAQNIHESSANSFINSFRRACEVLLLDLSKLLRPIQKEKQQHRKEYCVSLTACKLTDNQLSTALHQCLIDEYKMQVDDMKSDQQNEKDSKPDNTNEILCQNHSQSSSSSLKRKRDADESVACKRTKLSNDLTYFAFHDTWSSKRKAKRWSKTNGEELAMPTENNDKLKADGLQKYVTKHTVGKPLEKDLLFTFSINVASVDKFCTVRLKHNSSLNSAQLNHFQTFFAVFKKKIISTYAVK